MYPLLIIMLFYCHVDFQGGKFGVGKWKSLHRWPWQFALHTCSKAKPILTPHNQQYTLPETKRGVYSKISTISQSNKLIFQALSFSCYVTFREVTLILHLYNFKVAKKTLQHWVSQQLQPEVTQWKRSRPKISFTMALHRMSGKQNEIQRTVDTQNIHVWKEKPFSKPSFLVSIWKSRGCRWCVYRFFIYPVILRRFCWHSGELIPCGLPPKPLDDWNIKQGYCGY